MADDIDIREQTEANFAASLEVNHAAMPEDAWTTMEQMKMERDLDRPGDPPLRLMAWSGDRPIGTGYCGANIFLPEGRCRIGVQVVPEFRRRGIGSGVYDRLLAHAHERGVKIATVGLHELYVEPLGPWLDRNGYYEVERMRPSELKIDEFDASQWGRAEERIAGQGFALTTFATEDTELNRRKLYELSDVTHHDVPHDAADEGGLSYEAFCGLLDRPDARPDLLVIAKEGEKYVGFTILVHQTAERGLTGMTGVNREYRNRGLALALKVRCIELARQAGYTRMRTANHINNPSMLAVNNKLGYVPLPEFALFRKDLE